MKSCENENVSVSISPDINTQVLLSHICMFIIKLLGRVCLNIEIGDHFINSFGPYDWLFIDMLRRNSISSILRTQG